MRGISLVLVACKAILRFSEKYYYSHKSAYTSSQQTLLESLFAAAQDILSALSPVMGA
jgi:hypothetical protein